MSDDFFQECIEAELGLTLVAAIESGEIDIESRDCYDRTALMVALDYAKPELVSDLLESLDRLAWAVFSYRRSMS